jgi:hypothetical protein
MELDEALRKGGTQNEPMHKSLSKRGFSIIGKSSASEEGDYALKTIYEAVGECFHTSLNVDSNF